MNYTNKCLTPECRYNTPVPGIYCSICISNQASPVMSPGHVSIPRIVQPPTAGSSNLRRKNTNTNTSTFFVENNEKPQRKKHKCPICEALIYDLKPHLQTHSDNKSHKCPYESCGKSFKFKKALNNHMQTHTGQGICDVCLGMFTNLKKHKSAAHSGEPVPCTVPGCDKSFYNKDSRNRHIKSVHNNIKKHKCPEPGCPSEFSLTSEVSEHIRLVHSKENRFMCFECSASFKTKGRLIAHMSKHSKKSSAGPSNNFTLPEPPSKRPKY